MGRFRHIGNRPHTRTVRTQGHDSTTSEVIHRLWIRIRPARSLSFNRLCRKPPSIGKWPKILVAVTALEQHDVAECELPMLFLPIQDLVFIDETTLAVRSFVDES